MNSVLVILPKTGLGNKLLVWARAAVFANDQDLPLYVIGWSHLHVGAVLRREKHNRFYKGYFKNDTAIKARLLQIQLKLGLCKQVAEPQTVSAQRNIIYTFKNVASSAHMFLLLAPYRQRLHQQLLGLLSANMLAALQQKPVPDIAVHIRKGDFVNAGLATANNYFVTLITLISRHAKRPVQFTIFSDAFEAQISDVSILPNVKLASPAADIVDILLMAKSNMLITSQSSSFSYWAAFFLKGLVILPAGDWQTNIKTPGDEYDEYRWDGELTETFKHKLNQFL